MVEPQRKGAVSLRKGLIRPARGGRRGGLSDHPKGNVGLQLRVQEGRVRFERPLRVGHDRQRLIFDFDQIGRVTRAVAVGGHDRRHRIPDHGDLLLGQRRHRGDLHVRDGDHQRRGGRVLDLLAGPGRDHAGRTLGSLEVDSLQAGVGIAAAREGHVDGPRQA